MSSRHIGFVFATLAALASFFAYFGPAWISLAFGVLFVFAFAVAALKELPPGVRAQGKAGPDGFRALSVERASEMRQLLHRREVPWTSSTSDKERSRLLSGR
jgi:uncharacterized protein (DUF58 family)